MNGIKVGIDVNIDESLKKIIDQFQKALDKLHNMSENQKISLGIDKDISKQLDAIIQKMDKVGTKAKETKEKMETIFDTTKSGGSKLKNDNIAPLSYKDLENAMTRIKKNLNEITKIDVVTNSRNQITKAVIEYTNGVGRIAKETLKLKKGVLTTDNIDFTDNIKKSTSTLDKFQNKLENIRKSFSKIDFKDGGDAKELEKEYERINKLIEISKNSGYTLTNNEAKNIKNSITALRQKSEELIKINKLIEEETLAETENQRKTKTDLERKKADEQNSLYKQAEKSLQLQGQLERQLITADENKSKVIQEQLNIQELKTKAILKQLDLDNLLLLKEKEITEQNKTDLKLAEELDKQITARTKKEEQDRKQKEQADKDEKSRVSRLGTKLNSSPLDVNSGNMAIESYIKNLHNEEAQILRVNTALDRHGNSVKQIEYRVRDGANGFKHYQLNVDNATQSTYRLDKGTRDFQNRQLSLAQSIGISIKRFAEYQLTTRAVYEAFNQLRNGFNFVNDLNKSLTEIGIVTYQGQAQMKNFANEYNRMAKDMRVTTGEIASASVEFYRQGLSQEEVLRRLQTTTKYAKISNLDFKESAEILTATVNSMGESIDKVSDVFAYLGDSTATGADEIGRAMQKTAGSSHALDVSLEKTSSWIALLSSKTREGSEVIGKMCADLCSNA